MNADLFKPNLREIHDSLQRNPASKDEGSMKSVHKELRRKLKHQITMLTLGEQGIFYSNGTESATLPAHHRDVSDVSGAGDTVIAVATLCLAAGWSLENSASLANMAGGLVCEHPGVVPITIEMLESDLKN